MAISVSIMIPAYNQPGYIVQAVESALAQDYTNLEVIVADDSTNDGTRFLLERYLDDSRFKYFKNEKNLGRVDNYRKLVHELAKGEWVIMLDGDDYYIDNSYISKAVNLIMQTEGIVLVGAGIKILNEATNSFDSYGLDIPLTIFEGKELYYKYRKLPNHQTDLYNRKLANQLDFYRDPSTASDTESLYRLCLHGKVAYIPAPVAVWRVHTSNTTYTRNLQKQVKELVFIDRIYNYSLAYLDRQIAADWRKFMYRSLTLYLLNLSFEARSFKNVFSLLFRYGHFLGVKSGINNIRRLIRLYKNSLA